MKKHAILLVLMVLLNACKVSDVEANLVGIWNKVEYGQVLDNGTEYLEDVTNKMCPNDHYEFRLNGKHFMRNFRKMSKDENCKKDEDKRKYKIIDNHIVVNEGKYKYEIKELTSNYLKLYLYQHEFSDTSAVVYVYKFVRK